MRQLFKKTGHTKKRIRRKRPTYTKFYSVFLYDRVKFRLLVNYNRFRYKCHIRRNQAGILDVCYVRDVDDKLWRDTDVKSVFRYQTIQKIYELIYKQFPEPVTDNEFVIQDGLVFWPEEKQAEIIGTYNLPLRERLLKHIHLLRGLRDGKTLKEVLQDETL